METSAVHLVTGATGYVGGHLAAHLVDAGRRVRVLVRDPARLPDAPWVDDVEVVTGSVGDPTAVDAALDGVEVAYYLVHAMTDGDDYAEVDLGLAGTFADGCERAGVRRLVYLGGLQPRDAELTEHLRSRREVGETFLASSVPTAVLQAGIVLGPGSASYDLLVFAARRLPVVVGPRWLANLVQPIALEDLLVHLEVAAGLPPHINRTFDVGGTDALSYAQLLRACSRAIGGRPRPMVTFPVLLPHTTSLAMGTVSPGSTSLNTALVHSLSVDMVMTEDDFAAHLPPGYRRMDAATALRVAAQG